MIEMRVTGRGASSAPADAVEKVFGVQISGRKDLMAQMVHWEYGTKWGLARAFLAFFGLFGWVATLIHFLAIWVTAMIMLPSLGVAPSVAKWPPKQIITDGIFHLIYAIGAGVTYDWLHRVYSVV